MLPWVIMVGVCITGLHTPKMSMVFLTKPRNYISLNHNVLIVNVCFALFGLLNTDIHNLFKPRPSTVVEFKNHWKHVTPTHDMLTLFCTQDAPGIWHLPSAARRYSIPSFRFFFFVLPWLPIISLCKFHTTSSDSRLYSSYRASRMASCFCIAGRYTPRSLCMPLLKPLFSSSPSLDTKAAAKLW